MNLERLPKDKHYRFFEIAYTVALSAPGCGGTTGFRLGAVLVKKKQIVAARFNELVTHPKLIAFSEWPFLHSESACILSHGMDNCEGCKLYVVRILRNNSIAMAKPCSACQQLIDKVGISTVYYTKEDGYAALN